MIMVEGLESRDQLGLKPCGDSVFEMDPFYLALSYYRRKKYEKCSNRCSEILANNPYDQAAWVLKMKSLTESVYMDDLENEEISIADEFLDDNIIADAARPGTSLRNVKADGTSRPKTDLGRLLSGVVRTDLRSSGTGGMEQTLRSARRMKSTRPVTSRSGRYVRLGTSSMISDNENSFIEISRMNLAKYATEISGKHLFEYLFYHENDIQHVGSTIEESYARLYTDTNSVFKITFLRSTSIFCMRASVINQIMEERNKLLNAALELSTEAVKACDSNDWWWTVQQAKCFFYLNLFRESEQNLRRALQQHTNVDIFLRLIRIYKKLDQPLSALDVCKRALEVFPDEISFIIETARLHEALGNISLSVSFYRNVLLKDASNIEAIACTGLHYFYTDQPEIALRFYKRLLQMGVLNAEILNNIGLCCFYSQNFDLALSCFKRALSLSEGEDVANIWYNLSHVAIGIGDLNLARYCLRLCLAADGNHASALNNFGVLEIKRNKFSHAKAFFTAAISQAPLLFEPNFNHARLTYQCGDVQSGYKSVQKALIASPSNIHSIQLLDQLQRQLMQIQ